MAYDQMFQSLKISENFSLSDEIEKIRLSKYCPLIDEFEILPSLHHPCKDSLQDISRVMQGSKRLIELSVQRANILSSSISRISSSSSFERTNQILMEEELLVYYNCDDFVVNQSEIYSGHNEDCTLTRQGIKLFHGVVYNTSVRRSICVLLSIVCSVAVSFVCTSATTSNPRSNWHVFTGVDDCSIQTTLCAFLTVSLCGCYGLILNIDDLFDALLDSSLMLVIAVQVLLFPCVIWLCFLVMTASLTDTSSNGGVGGAALSKQARIMDSYNGFQWLSAAITPTSIPLSIAASEYLAYAWIASRTAKFESGPTTSLESNISRVTAHGCDDGFGGKCVWSLAAFECGRKAASYTLIYSVTAHVIMGQVAPMWEALQVVLSADISPSVQRDLLVSSWNACDSLSSVFYQVMLPFAVVMLLRTWWGRTPQSTANDNNCSPNISTGRNGRHLLWLKTSRILDQTYMYIRECVREILVCAIFALTLLEVCSVEIRMGPSDWSVFFLLLAVLSATQVLMGFVSCLFLQWMKGHQLLLSRDTKIIGCSHIPAKLSATVCALRFGVGVSAFGLLRASTLGLTPQASSSSVLKADGSTASQYKPSTFSQHDDSLKLLAAMILHPLQCGAFVLILILVGIQR